MKRVVVNVSDEFHEILQRLAEQEVRSIPNTLLWLAQQGFAQQSLAQEKQHPKAS